MKNNDVAHNNKIFKEYHFEIIPSMNINNKNFISNKQIISLDFLDEFKISLFSTAVNHIEKEE